MLMRNCHVSFAKRIRFAILAFGLTLSGLIPLVFSQPGAASASATPAVGKTTYATASAAPLTTNPTASAAMSAPYRDIHGHWAETQLKEWHASGLLKGFPDGTFRPDHLVTEEQFFALLLRVLPSFRGHEPDAFARETYLKDVQGSWSEEVYTKLWAAGITSFGRPDAELKRLLAARTLLRALAAEGRGDAYQNTREQRFRDVPLHIKDGPNGTPIFNEYGITTIYPVVDLGVMKGYPDGTFRPEQGLTRAEAIVVLSRLATPMRSLDPGDVPPATRSSLIATLQSVFDEITNARIQTFSQLEALVQEKRLPVTASFLEEHFGHLKLDGVDFPSPPQFDELIYFSRAGADGYRVTVQYYAGELGGSRAVTYCLKQLVDGSLQLVGDHELAIH